MEFFSNIFAVIVRPKVSLKKFADTYNSGLLLQGILAYLIATMIDSQLLLKGAIDSIINLVFLAIMVFLAGYVFKLKSEDFPKIICLCCFASVPLIFSAPVRLLGGAPFAPDIWLSLALGAWVFVLNVYAISYACHISKRRVVLFFAIPLIAFVYLITSSIIYWFI